MNDKMAFFILDLLRTRFRKIAAWCPYLLTATAILCATLFGLRHAIALAEVIRGRWDYPFELEWMEGGILHHVVRVMNGDPLYGEPAPEFMSFIYTPFYYWLGALVLRLTAVGLPGLRLLSVIGLLASCLSLALLVYRVTFDRLLSLFSIFLFLATFTLSGSWFDIARVDSVALALTLASLAVLTCQSGIKRFLISGLLIGLAFLTKQNAIIIAPALVLYAVTQGGLRGLLALTCPAIAVICGVSLWQQFRSDGWFWYYIIEIPLSHGMKKREYLLYEFWKSELFANLPVLSVFSTIALFTTCIYSQRRRIQHHTLVSNRYLARAASVCMLLGSYASRLHMGSYINDLMPAHIALIWLGTLGLAEWKDRPLLSQDSVDPTSTVTRFSHYRWIPFMLIALQLALLSPPSVQNLVPTDVDRTSGWSLVDRIRKSREEILMINHPHYSILAGNPTYAHQMAMIDVFEADDDPRGVRKLLQRKWKVLIEQKKFGEIIADNEWYVFFRELSANYYKAGTLGLPKKALLPKTGTPFRPTLIWKPK